MFFDPRVVIFRDLLSDVDIATIKELATPRVNTTRSLSLCIGVALCDDCCRSIA